MNKTTYFYPKFCRIPDNVSQAANNAFAGRMRTVGREFETPELGDACAQHVRIMAHQKIDQTVFNN